jgi:electron transport complex protein RnfC
VHNVATCFAIYEAVYKNKPLYERVVTVAGSCIPNPKNLLVRIGAPIKDLLDFCGPLKLEPAKIIIGGPMMGIAQYSDEVPVIKSSTGIILQSAKEAANPDEDFCIRCGACVRECPVNLMPCIISLASQRNNRELIEAYNVSDCIECGICSFVCPAKRDMVQHMKYAKSMLASQK